MGSEGPRRALLLGLVEVRQPPDQLDEDGQTRMFALCHTASIAGHVDDTDWLGWHERGLMGVEVVLDQTHLHVTSNEVLVSRHSIAEISAIAALQDTEGHLVVVGQCQVKGHHLAVVLDMMSQEDARRLEEEVGMRLSRRLVRPSVQSSASRYTLCTETVVPSAPPLQELDSSASLPDTWNMSALQHADQATVQTSASSGTTRTQSPSSVVQPSSCSSYESNQPSLSKKILAGTLRLKPPMASMSPTGTLLATPLRCTFHPPVSRVAHAPVSGLTLSRPLVSDAPVSTQPVATPLVSIRQASNRPPSTRPLSTPSAPTPSVSNPSLFSRSVSIHPASSQQASTSLVSGSQVSLASSSPVSTSQVPTSLASTSLVSTPPVSTHSVTLRPVSTLPVSTRPVSTPPISSSPVPTGPRSKPALPTKPMSNATVSSRPVPPSRTFTPLVPTLPVSISSSSTSTVSSSSVSTTRFPGRLISLPKIVTPLVVATTESNKTVPPTPVCTPSVSTRSVPKPIVATRPMSFPKISVPLSTTPMSKAVASDAAASNTAMSNTPASNTPASNTPASNTPASNTPASNTAMSNTAASNTAASNTPASNTPASNTAMSNTAASNTPAFSTAACNTAMSNTPESVSSMSTTPLSTTVVSATPVSTLPVSDQSASPAIVSSSPMPTLPETTVIASNLPTSSPLLSTLAADTQLRRRYSIASSSSLEEDNTSGSEKVELILGTLNVDESENLFIPRMKHTQKQDSSSSLENELSVLLENEHQYLDILQRIKDARSFVKSELQNLLRRNERLADFHKDLFRDLHQEFPSCSGITRVFLSRREDLEQYRYYLMNAPLVLRQLGQQTEEVTRQHPTLEEDLKSTWKRLHYYFMTFDKISKTVSAEEQPLVQELVDLLRDMNRQGDSAILIDGVSEAPFSLHTLGSLLLHGLFTIKDSTGILKSKAKHHVLLFEEMMVITLPKKERHEYKDHLPIRQLNLRQSDGDEATFVLDFVQGGNKKNRRFTFKSRQQESKDAWVNELARLHLEYAKEVKRLSKLRYGWQ